MEININNFRDAEAYDIDLRQEDISGGSITKEQIDIIKQYPEAKSVVISGLDQNAFEYFISTYGNQFNAIYFWKNKKVEDLSLLAELEHIEYISYFFNQKASKLWNMSKNHKLRAIQIEDFTNLHTVEGIESAPALELFSIGNAVWARMKIESFQPVALSKIIQFSWYGDKVNDSDFLCLANGRIKKLDISPQNFTMDELAKLLSAFPENIEGTITIPYSVGRIIEADGSEKTYYILCKGKRKCIKGKDDLRFQEYLEEFFALKEMYRKQK